MKRLVLVLLVVAAVRVEAQEPTELYDCLDDADGPSFCSDSTAVLVDEGCGATFNRYRGRISWPVLRNVGPVTIAVKTRDMGFIGTTAIPLYVQVFLRNSPNDPKDCRTWGFGGLTVMVAQGGAECGGAWASVGPFNLSHYGIPLGELYSIQMPFFESLPHPGGPPPYTFHSIGFSCIRVTLHPTAVASTTWSNMKILFR